MKKVETEFPGEVLISLKKTPEEFSQEIRLAAAAKLYELGKLSSGRAAQLAGVSRIAFPQILGRYGAPAFNLTAEKLKRDMQNA